MYVCILYTKVHANDIFAEFCNYIQVQLLRRYLKFFIDIHDIMSLRAHFHDTPHFQTSVFHLSYA